MSGSPVRRCHILSKRARSRQSPGERRTTKHSRFRSAKTALNGGSAAAHDVEDGERVVARGLPDELAAGLGGAVQPRSPARAPPPRRPCPRSGSGSGVPRCSPRPPARPPAGSPRSATATRPAPPRARCRARAPLPPRSPAAARPTSAPRREPALHLGHLRLDPVLGELGLDDLPRLVGLRRARRVDEELAPVARDGELSALEVLREPLRLVGAEAVLEPAGDRLGVVLLRGLDADAVVVAHAVGAAAAPVSASGCPNILSDLPVWSRNLVIPPSQNGQPAPSRSAVSTSAASATTPSSAGGGSRRPRRRARPRGSPPGSAGRSPRRRSRPCLRRSWRESARAESGRGRRRGGSRARGSRPAGRPSGAGPRAPSAGRAGGSRRRPRPAACRARARRGRRPSGASGGG